MLNVIKRTRCIDGGCGGYEFKPYSAITDSVICALADIHRRMLNITENEYLKRFNFENREDWDIYHISRLEDLRVEKCTNKLRRMKSFAIYQGWSYDYLGIYLAKSVLSEIDTILSSDLHIRTNQKMYTIMSAYLYLADISTVDFVKKHKIVANESNTQATNLKLHEIANDAKLPSINKVIWRWCINCRLSPYQYITSHGIKLTNLVEKLIAYCEMRIWAEQKEGGMHYDGERENTEI